MKIAIICNGWKCRLKENGDFIDSCDLVIRMNRFILEGFEKYVGSKTDIISLMITGEGSTNGILGHDELLTYTHNIKNIWIPDKYRLEHQESRDRASDHFRIRHNNFLFVDAVIYDNLYQKMIDLSEGERDHYYPDSGMTTIESVLYRHPAAELWVFGFDPHRAYPYRYYWQNEREIALNDHPQIAESKLFDYYKSIGKVHEPEI